MKSTKDFRSKINDFGTEDLIKKPAKLEPIKKSGKEKRTIYSSLELDDEEEVLLKKRESILDYFDDGESDEDDAQQEDDEFDEEDEFDEDEYEDDQDPEEEDEEDDYRK